MILELLAGGCGIVAWQLWAATHSDWRILGAEVVGTAGGTWVAMAKKENA